MDKGMDRELQRKAYREDTEMREREQDKREDRQNEDR